MRNYLPGVQRWTIFTLHRRVQRLDLSDGFGIRPDVWRNHLNKEGEYEIARTPNGTIQWAFANSSPGWNWISTGAVAPLNQWSHIAVTYDNGTIKTYLNGNLAHTYNGAGSIGDATPSQNDFRVGGRQAGPQHFQGRIDVRVYNRALTASEVSSLLSGGLKRPQYKLAGGGSVRHAADDL